MKLMSKLLIRKNIKKFGRKNISYFNALLYQKQRYFRKLSKFYCFFKKSIKYFRFRTSKRYKKLIVNFIKLDKSKLTLNNLRRNK
jgi:cytochrome c1